MADLANAFIAGANLGLARRGAREAERTNAFNRQVTQQNLLMAQNAQAQDMARRLVTAGGRAALWADSPDKWPAAQQYMVRAYQMAGQMGFPAPLVEQGIAEVQQSTFADRGPIVAQVQSFDQPKQMSPKEIAQAKILAGQPLSPEERRLAGTLEKEKPKTDKMSKPLVSTADENLISREVDKAFSGIRSPLTQELMRFGDPKTAGDARNVKARAARILQEQRRAGVTISAHEGVRQAFLEAMNVTGNESPQADVPYYDAAGNRIR
jgi:hypothetical protein